MSFLLRLVGSYLDAVLNTFYPLEQEPSMADVEAERLADKEAEEDVAEPVLRSENSFHSWCKFCHGPCLIGTGRAHPRHAEFADEVGTGGRVGPDDLWPEQPDPLSHIAALVEDIRNLIQSSAAYEGAAESPTPVVPPAGVGHPNLAAYECNLICIALTRYADKYPVVRDECLAIANKVNPNK